MRKTLLFVALLSVMATTFAQEKIKDVRTKPDLYFLQIGEVLNSYLLLLNQVVSSSLTTKPNTNGA